MRWKHTLPVFLAGMVSASLAFHAVNRIASADENRAPTHTASKIVSYGLGWDLATETLGNLAYDGVTVDAAAMARGFEAALTGSDPAFDAERMKIALIEFNDEIFDAMHEEMMRNDPIYRARAAENARIGEEARKRFAAMPNVKSTDSGMLYRVDRSGDGPSPRMGDSVNVSYRVLLLDGTEIGEEDDAVVDTRTMLKFGQELIQIMHVGDKWTVFVAPQGADGRASRNIGAGPNEAIIAEIELLGIADQPE